MSGGANVERGQITLALADLAVPLCPSFSALVALEEATGTGLVTLARRFAEGAFTLKDVEAVIRAGIIGAGQQPPADLGARILQSGVAALAPTIGSFLVAALGGTPPQGKA